MRQVILDTETTGLKPEEGHRVIEIGCVEIAQRKVTENRFQSYLNPGRASDPGALAVHGLTEEFLSDQPAFEDVVDSFLAFVTGAELIIHNAGFDTKFLDAELERLGKPPIASYAAKITDTILMARELYPGSRVSLDSLCTRLGINNAHRTLHGALLDAELLAEVFISMTRGQESLVIDEDRAGDVVESLPLIDPGLIPQASNAEMFLHWELVNHIGHQTKSQNVWAIPAELITAPPPKK
jgi:DNA polymerase III subunit epsilon